MVSVRGLWLPRGMGCSRLEVREGIEIFRGGGNFFRGGGNFFRGKS